MLFVLPKTPDQVEYLARRLPAPLMYMTLNGGFESMPFDIAGMGRLGYKFLVDPMTPVLALHKVMSESYQAMAASAADPWIGGQYRTAHEALNLSIDIEKLLEIERATVER
jgi:hypothetical protein